jgi:hypothetical protein
MDWLFALGSVLGAMLTLSVFIRTMHFALQDQTNPPLSERERAWFRRAELVGGTLGTLVGAGALLLVLVSGPPLNPAWPFLVIGGVGFSAMELGTLLHGWRHSRPGLWLLAGATLGIAALQLWLIFGQHVGPGTHLGAGQLLGMGAVLAGARWDARFHARTVSNRTR